MTNGHRSGHRVIQPSALVTFFMSGRLSASILWPLAASHRVFSITDTFGTSEGMREKDNMWDVMKHETSGQTSGIHLPHLSQKHN